MGLRLMLLFPPHVCTHQVAVSQAAGRPRIGRVATQGLKLVVVVALLRTYAFSLSRPPLPSFLSVFPSFFLASG